MGFGERSVNIAMKDQIRAVKKARVAGWYVWSAGNQYAAVYAALAK